MSSPEKIRSAWPHIIAAALLLTLLNAIKPAHIDDPVYITYAKEFSAHPLDPYNFEFGSPYARSGNDLVVPPVFPYWLGLEIRMFGDNTLLLKLGLFPFALLLAWAIDVLAIEFAPTLRRPVLWLGLLSPTILPGFNLMLDVPMLALGLAGLAAAIRSIERDSNSLVVVSGVFAGLAIETKYTGFIECAVIIAYFVMRGRANKGAIVAAIGLTLFLGWELAMSVCHGESHFVHQFRIYGGRPFRRVMHLIMPLLTQAAGLAPIIALFGLTALGYARRTIVFVSVIMVAGLVTLALVPGHVLLVNAANGTIRLTLTNIVYAVLMVILWPVVGRVCLRLWQEHEAGPERFLNIFLLVWLGIELAGYFVFTPHPAARRLNGLVLVFTFLIARLAFQQKISPRAVTLFAACSVAVALVFYVTDLFEARAGEVVADRVVQRSDSLSAKERLWYASWSEFGYYAERKGLRPLQLNRQVPVAGDLIAVEDVLALRRALETQRVVRLERRETVSVHDNWPFRVVPGYYAGRTPLDHRANGRSPVIIYQVAAASTP